MKFEEIVGLLAEIKEEFCQLEDQDLDVFERCCEDVFVVEI